MIEVTNMCKTCEDLELILKHEMTRGNQIVTITKWGDYDVVYFKKRMDISKIKKHLLNENISFQVNKDPHYMTEEFICERHKKVIMGPNR